MNWYNSYNNHPAGDDYEGNEWSFIKEPYLVTVKYKTLRDGWRCFGFAFEARIDDFSKQGAIVFKEEFSLLNDAKQAAEDWLNTYGEFYA